MSWFCAELIFEIMSKGEPFRERPVIQTLVLLEAENWEEADNKASKIGKDEAAVGNDLCTDDGFACYKIFLGIRKIRLTHNLEEDDEIGSARPGDRTELLESQFLIDQEFDVDRLVAGEEVVVRYTEDIK